MKLILHILFALMLSSCTKESIEKAAVNPVTSVSFYPVYAGAGSIGFTVTLNITSPVTKVNLIKFNNYQIVWTVKNPESKTYTMYHHAVDYPTYPQSWFYFLEFHMEDGTIISGEKFQVY